MHETRKIGGYGLCTDSAKSSLALSKDMPFASASAIGEVALNRFSYYIEIYKSLTFLNTVFGNNFQYFGSTAVISDRSVI